MFGRLSREVWNKKVVAACKIYHNPQGRILDYSKCSSALEILADATGKSRRKCFKAFLRAEKEGLIEAESKFLPALVNAKPTEKGLDVLYRGNKIC